jgi:siroheme synthase (precorrin-2 oxidase/ferrochelatase)
MVDAKTTESFIVFTISLSSRFSVCLLKSLVRGFIRGLVTSSLCYYLEREREREREERERRKRRERERARERASERARVSERERASERESCKYV